MPMSNLIQRYKVGRMNDLFQTVAMLTMLIDHIGIIFFPEQMVWRIIGRLAFPLYAYSVVQGFLHTSNVRKYFIRLGLLALISQIPYMLSLDTFEINVIGTLLISLMVLVLLEKYRQIYFQILIVTGVALILDWMPIDYGAYALFLIVAYRYSPSKWMITWHVLITLFYFMNGMPTYQLFSVTATAWLIIQGNNKVTMSWSVPRWLWLMFYPAHLLLLFMLKGLIFLE